MGFRLRKSKNLGLGFRVNVSSKGIGYSWGVPGFRVTKGSNGVNKTTLSIPRTGISYVTTQGTPKNSIQTTKPSSQIYQKQTNNITAESSTNNQIYQNNILNPNNSQTQNMYVFNDTNKKSNWIGNTIIIILIAIAIAVIISLCVLKIKI